jgi:membrane fusion protein, heavy metal efflux system
MTRVLAKRGTFSARSQLALVVAVVAIATAAFLLMSTGNRGGSVNAKASEEPREQTGKFRPTAAQWTTLTIRPVELRRFATEHFTEGKIAIDEDRSTPIFSLYAGRVSKLLVAPGDKVQRGQPLFVLEAGDSLQAQNDFIAALTNLNKARTLLRLTETVERRLQNLYDAKAMPLKDLQQAQADLAGAQNDLRSAQTALEAMRNRLRILGKTDAEIDKFQESGAITADSMVHAPLSGTIVQRKVGPGQYVAAGSADPVFVIGDLSTVWLVAYVRESEASKVKVGLPVKFRVLAYPDRVFDGRINYVATALDPSTRRLMVRATIDNAEGLLKPEMFASVTISVTDDSAPTAAIPLSAIIYEGDTARAWVAIDGEALEVRQLKLGLSSGDAIQVLEGLGAGDKVVTRGTLFVDRAAGS